MPDVPMADGFYSIQMLLGYWNDPLAQWSWIFPPLLADEENR